LSGSSCGGCTGTDGWVETETTLIAPGRHQTSARLQNTDPNIVYFSDLANFSVWAADQDPAEVAVHLRELAKIQIDLIRKAGGQIDKLSVLSFLNMHYRVWDSIVDGESGDRVDYHGARLDTSSGLEI
jgi:hypothetical protein